MCKQGPECECVTVKSLIQCYKYKRKQKPSMAPRAIAMLCLCALGLLLAWF